jgi:carbamoyl-phosphate synthase large subunit
MTRAIDASPDKPVLIDDFLESAIEVDVDALSDGTRTIVGGVMQHIEQAGIHSGDSACIIPPHSLPASVVEGIKRQTRELARELKVKGLMNIQFAVRKQHEPSPTAIDGHEIYVLEVNPRASRTVPFVSKVIGLPLAKYASLVMVGKTLDDLGVFDEITPKHYSCKESVLPFNKFPGVDILLGPEMRSTGEVMGIDDDFAMAFAKGMLAANTPLPLQGGIFISVCDRDKDEIGPIAREFHRLGYKIYCTDGTGQALKLHGVECTVIPKIRDGRPNLLDLMMNGEVVLIINTPSGKGYHTDEGKIRSTAVGMGVTCITTLSAAHAAVAACAALRDQPISVRAIQDRYPAR